MAAGLTCSDRIAKAVRALRADKRFKCTALRNDSANTAAITLFGFGPDIVCLAKQPAGIERDQIDIELLERTACDRLVLKSEAGGKNQRPAMASRARQRARKDRGMSTSDRRRQSGRFFGPERVGNYGGDCGHERQTCARAYVTEPLNRIIYSFGAISTGKIT